MSEMLTDTELYAIRARAEAATSGPWRIVTDKDRQDSIYAVCAVKSMFIPFNGTNRKHDSSFCAHARTDIPALLEHIDEQKAALSKAEADKSALVEALEEMVAIAEAIAVWESTPENADGPLIKAHAVLASIKAQP